MATYGLTPTPGFVNFTGYTNTLASGQANTASSSGQVQFNGVSQGDDRIAKMVRNGAMTLGVFALMNTLLGAAAGQTATKTKKQVQWQQGSPGGAIPIETITLVNRATTAADLTAFQALMARTPAPASYPADVSGVGGGGKVTY